MRASRLAIACALVAIAAPAWAKGKADKDKDKDEDSSSDDDSDSSDDSDDTGDTGDDTPKAKAKAKAKSSDEDTGGDEAAKEPVLQKQDLTGHDLGTNKRANMFEKDRFFVDKVDTEKTEDGTLIQGSLTASTFLYAESGGAYAGGGTGNDSGPSRMFGDLRLQTDFRHIAGSRFEARLDGRIRAVNTPTNILNTQPNHIQAGFNGQNEYDLRELWLVRNGERSDVFVGRQYVPDLGALKIDGLRIDYASSQKFTLIGFGGLYPVRGSRSIDTDYKGSRTATGGFGAAYRTLDTYGAIGGVALIPLPGSGEQPRVYASSNGYWRRGPKLDLYHFAIIDLFGSAGFQLTNLSAGVNYKPSQRLRVTANFNRVDTETLNVQANAFLNPVDTTLGGNLVVQNEAYIYRIATNQFRAGVSAGLGELQRFELSTAMSYRQRPEFTLITPDVMTPDITLQAASSVEVWGGITDRRSIKDMRIGLDGSKTFGVGNIAFQRNESTGLRLFGARELANGRGEWEAEIAYASVADTPAAGMTCADLTTCYGISNSSLLSLGGQLYYRINRDWFAIASMYLSRIDNTRSDGTTSVVDPTVTGFSGYGRIAYRF
jgi:hypothetical protein